MHSHISTIKKLILTIGLSLSIKVITAQITNKDPHRTIQSIQIQTIRELLNQRINDDDLKKKTEMLTRNADGLQLATHPTFVAYKKNLETGLALPPNDLRTFLTNYLHELEKEFSPTATQKSDP